MRTKVTSKTKFLRDQAVRLGINYYGLTLIELEDSIQYEMQQRGESYLEAYSGYVEGHLRPATESVNKIQNKPGYIKKGAARELLQQINKFRFYNGGDILEIPKSYYATLALLMKHIKELLPHVENMELTPDASKVLLEQKVGKKKIVLDKLRKQGYFCISQVQVDQALKFYGIFNTQDFIRLLKKRKRTKKIFIYNS